MKWDQIFFFTENKLIFIQHILIIVSLQFLHTSPHSERTQVALLTLHIQSPVRRKKKKEINLKICNKVRPKKDTDDGKGLLMTEFRGCGMSCDRNLQAWPTFAWDKGSPAYSFRGQGDRYDGPWRAQIAPHDSMRWAWRLPRPLKQRTEEAEAGVTSLWFFLVWALCWSPPCSASYWMTSLFWKEVLWGLVIHAEAFQVCEMSPRSTYSCPCP